MIALPTLDFDDLQSLSNPTNFKRVAEIFVSEDNFSDMAQCTNGHFQWDNDCKFFGLTFAAVYEHECQADLSSWSSYNGKCAVAYWGKVYPCATAKYYFVRGPFQLSWNNKYGAFSI